MQNLPHTHALSFPCNQLKTHIDLLLNKTQNTVKKRNSKNLTDFVRGIYLQIDLSIRSDHVPRPRAGSLAEAVDRGRPVVIAERRKVLCAADFLASCRVPHLAPFADREKDCTARGNCRFLF